MEHKVMINGIEVNAFYSDREIQEIFFPLIQTFQKLQREKNRRILVFLAAPPGAGKSTLCSFLPTLSPDIVPLGMDGFHRRQEYLLSHMAERDGETFPMVRIKGAPITFDLERLQAFLARAAAGEEFGWPVYNRMTHNPQEDAIFVKGNILLIEGNYLLLDQDGWRDLSRYADYTIRILADEETLRQRLVDRKIKSGASPEAAEEFVMFSDMPNVRLCLECSKTADITLLLTEKGFERY